MSRYGPSAAGAGTGALSLCGRRAVARACSLLTHVKRMQNSFCPCACARSIDRERRRRSGAVCRPPAGAPEPEAAGRACVRSSLVGLSLRCGTSSEQLGDREIDRRTKSTRERGKRGVIFWQDVRPNGRRREGGERVGGCCWVRRRRTGGGEGGGETLSNRSREPTTAKSQATTSARPPQTIRQSCPTDEGGIHKCT